MVGERTLADLVCPQPRLDCVIMRDWGIEYTLHNIFPLPLISIPCGWAGQTSWENHLC